MPRLPSLAIFRHRLFRRYWLVRLTATLGVQMQATAMGWQIYDVARAQGQSVLEGSFLLGLVGLAQFLPLLVLSLFGGQAADRYNRKRILILCLIAKAAIVALLAAATAFDQAITLTIFVAAALAGAVNAFMPPAATALLPMLVPREDLPQAIAWSSLGFQSGLIAGPVFGGLLYGVSAPAPYLVALVLFAAGALAFATLATPAQAPIEQSGALRMIGEGLAYVWSNKIVLGAISLDLIVVLLAGAVALLPVFARDILHAGPDELGVLRSAMGVGAALVALALAARPIRTRVGAWMFASVFVFGLATIAFGLSQNLWLTALALAVAGGFDMISVYVRQTLIQLATPDDMRGRVGAVSFVFISASNELGDFEAGLMARIFGPVLAVVLGGGAAIAAAAGWMRLFPELAKADGFEPAPVRRDPA